VSFTASLVFITAAVSAAIVVLSTINSAEAILVPLEEHWKHNVYWTWDDKLQRTIGIINPTIVIENETATKLEGYIADQNGTRLAMYNGEQIVMVRFAYEGGAHSKWEMRDRIYGGYFTIDIPEEYKNADIVGIYIGKNHYTVDNGTPLTPQSWVFINSARMDYDRTLVTNSTLVQTSTEIAQEKADVTPTGPSPGSLIDRILSYYGLLSV